MTRKVNLKRFPSNIGNRISVLQARREQQVAKNQTNAEKREAEIKAAFDYELSDFIGYDQVADTDKQLKNSPYRAVEDTEKKVPSNIHSFDISDDDTSIYPGKLVKIDKKNFLKNGPQDLAVGIGQRAKKMITVESGSKRVSQELEIIRYDNKETNDFIEKAINECFKLNNGKPLAIKTNIAFNGEEIYTKEHLDTKVTCNIPSIKTNAEVSFSSDKQENHLLYKISQVFYKATFDASSNISPTSYFNLEKVNQDMINLLNTCKKEKTPAAYVSEVSYGRVIYIMLSSTLSVEEIKTSLDVKLDGIAELGSKTDSKNEKKTIKATIYSIGGGMGPIAALSSAAMLDFVANRDKIVKAIEDVLHDYEFKNPAYAVPISYKLKYLKNNQDVIIENSFKDVDITDQIKVTFKAGNLGSVVRIFPRYIAPKDLDGDGKLDWEIYRKEDCHKVTAHLTGDSIYLPARARFVQFSVSNDTAYKNHTIIFDRLPLTGDMKNKDGDYELTFKVSGTKCDRITLNEESNYMHFNQKYSLYENKDYTGYFKNGTTITHDDAKDAGFNNSENYVEYLANTDFKKYSDKVDGLYPFIEPSRTKSNDQKEQ